MAAAAALTARSAPTTPAVATSSDAASRARESIGAMASAEANSRKATPWSRSRTTVSAVMLLSARPAVASFSREFHRAARSALLTLPDPVRRVLRPDRSLSHQDCVVGGLDPPGPDHSG